MYKDKAWLELEYVYSKKSSCEIAKDLKVSDSTILRWLHKFKIPVRRKEVRT